MTTPQQQKLIQTTVERAVSILEKTKCEFTVYDAFGKRFTSKKRAPNQDYSHLQIRQRIEAADFGDELQFPLGGLKADRVQSAVTSMAERLLGAGNYRSTQDRSAQVIRLTVLGNHDSDDLNAAIASLETKK